MEQPINQRVGKTDIFLFRYNPKTKLYTYSRPFSANEAATLAQRTNETIASQYGNASGLSGGLRANKDGELFNMSILKGIVANQVLRQRTEGKQWLPTISELIQVQRAGMFPKNILIDGGIALYGAGNPDKEIAQALIATANERAYGMPVLASFNSLGLTVGGKRYGVTPQLVSDDGLIHGTSADKVLDDNSFVRGDSGVRRLGWYGGCGGWYAGWVDVLGHFDEYCRVGRFSAVGSAQILQADIDKEKERVYTAKKKGLDEEVERIRVALRDEETAFTAEVQRLLKR